MRTLERRLAVLEFRRRDGPSHLVLSGLTSERIEQIEAIAVRVEAGTAIEELPDDDLRLLASIRVAAGERE
jgi:hypothetical protein